jgi:hypothetical protein
MMSGATMSAVKGTKESALTQPSGITYAGHKLKELLGRLPDHSC